jgi:hypothetical protein
MSNEHSALFVQYFEKLPQLDQLAIIKNVIEKFEENLKQSGSNAPNTAPTAKLSIAPALKSALKSKPTAKRKKAGSKKRATKKVDRIGKLTILDNPYNSPREVFHEFDLSPGTWYKKIKGKTIKQMEKLIEAEINRRNLDKVKPIKKNGVVRRPKLMHSGKDGSVEVK